MDIANRVSAEATANNPFFRALKSHSAFLYLAQCHLHFLAFKDNITSKSRLILLPFTLFNHKDAVFIKYVSNLGMN